STGELVELADKDPRVEIRQREVSLEEFEHQVVGLDHLSVWADDVLNGLYSDFEHNNLVKELLERNIEPNLVFEEDRFLNRIEEVKDEVGPFYINIQEGEVILSAGEIVSEDVYVLLRRMNRAEVKFRIFGGITRLGIVLLGMGFIFIYLREYRPDFFEKYNLLAVIAIIIAGLVAAARILQIMQPHLPSGIEYGFPYTAAIILLAILISPQMALLISLFLSLLAVSFFGFGFELFALYLLGGLAGLFSVKDIDRRTELMRSGAIVAAVQIYAVFLFYIIRTGNVLELELGVKLAWAAFNGAILVPFVVVGILPFLENGFNITTNFKLQELADLNHPLLQKLFIKAPGSYQHSIMLSNLCEQGAQAIGANTLLVRAGTYFHDIGKAEMPEYFVENQGEGNPHDELKPTLSASILKTHVKKGVELAEENNLPREIIDMIKQHHGTTKIQYFYHRALETEEEVNEEEFRYPGPIPQFKEAAILMVGDSVEAAARTIENPTHKKIREVVQSVVYDKFKQGQLNQCELTLKDLDTIVETFTRVLASIHHKRISYPDDEENGHPGEKQPSEKK
ncbi:MAG: HD family phosphohydrolase, partial [bacterium]